MQAFLPERVVADEAAFLQGLVPLEGASLAELGCGKAEFARELVNRAPVASLIAFEVDRIQHRSNLQSPMLARLEFRYGAAESIDLPDASLDGVLMMKSLHHVPAGSMDTALAEIRRVLRPGGWLYVSEPVYAGDFNDIVKLFHDEGEVRAQAYQALGRAVRSHVLEMEREESFMAPLAFRDYDDFVDKLVRVTHSTHAYTAGVAAQVRARFAAYETPEGARFMRPMRVNLLRRPA